MWWDVARGFSCVDLTGDPEVVLARDLNVALTELPWDELHVVYDQLRQLEDFLSSVPHLRAERATLESEAPFVDRALDGEVVLTNPDPGLDNPMLFAAALNQQILTAPDRWQLDLHENLCLVIEARLANEPAVERIRSRFRRSTLGARMTASRVRRRALANFRTARAERAETASRDDRNR